MSAPVELRGPAAAAIPLVLDSPHSGHFFPGDFDAVVSEAELREGEDCYVDELYAGGPEIGAPLLAALWPRTYLDPNRHAGDVDLDLIEGSWPGECRPSGKAKVGKALIWRTLEDGRPIYARKLSPEAVKKRIEVFHVPYHEKIKNLLNETHARFGRVYHINCHSMRSVAGRQSEDREGNVRAYSEPKAGRHSLQIEISKRLYMDEATLRKSAGFANLQKNLSGLLHEIKAFI